MNTEELSQLIREEELKGKVVIQTIEGLRSIKIEDLLNQPIEHILYDLNRDKATCMTFIGETTWINNNACAEVIKFLYKYYEKR